MKYSTQELYDLDPKELAKMTYKDALEAQLKGAKRKLDKLVHRKTKLSSWTDEDHLKHEAYSKAVEWCKAKLEEIEMRMYNLEGKSILALKQLRDLIAVNPDLTVEEKQANISEIDSRLHIRSVTNALVEGAEIVAGEVE